MYIHPDKVRNKQRTIDALSSLFDSYGYERAVEYLPRAMEPQKHRYVRLLVDANPRIAQRIKQLKQLDFYRDKQEKEEYLQSILSQAPLIAQMKETVDRIYSLDYDPTVRYRYRNTTQRNQYTYVDAPMRELFGL